MAVWGGLTNSYEKNRSEKQRREGKIQASERRVPKNSKKRQEGLLQWRIQRNRGKQQKGKTRDLFRKIGNTKGTFHPKMGTIKDRESRDLVEAEEIKENWKIAMDNSN